MYLTIANAIHDESKSLFISLCKNPMTSSLKLSVPYQMNTTIRSYSKQNNDVFARPDGTDRKRFEPRGTDNVKEPNIILRQYLT